MQLSSFAIKSNDTKENVELFKQNNPKKVKLRYSHMIFAITFNSTGCV